MLASTFLNNGFVFYMAPLSLCESVQVLTYATVIGSSPVLVGFVTNLFLKADGTINRWRTGILQRIPASTGTTECHTQIQE